MTSTLDWPPGGGTTKINTPRPPLGAALNASAILNLPWVFGTHGEFAALNQLFELFTRKAPHKYSYFMRYSALIFTYKYHYDYKTSLKGWRE
ncbi:MAG: hypothetical protein RLZZ371_2180 [Pseudomonadota bacterium]